MNLAADHPNAPALGITLDGRYTLHRLVGLGGLGAVYEAMTPQDERVAVKVLLALTGTVDVADVLARFDREAKVAGALSSPYVVPVLGSGTHKGAPYLVMPLLDGLDLASLLERTGALHPTVAVRIACHVCRALIESHSAGVVHRDVKPANIYLHHDSSGAVTARVLDFGLAKVLQSSTLTRTGSFLGTPHYMAPEQVIDAKRVDERADVWSVGATLYAALSGAPLFAEVRNITHLLLQLTSGNIAPLQQQAPWIDGALAHVVHGCLLSDLDARCPDAEALLAALLPFSGESEQLSAAMLDQVPDHICEQIAKSDARPTLWSGSREPTVEIDDPEASQQADPLLKSNLGRYTLVCRLGRGGMGSVYEAKAPNGDRVAIKVMSKQISERNPRARRRFVREARAAMKIDSDHVVKVLEADEADGTPFIVMELLEGIDLSRMLTRRGALAPAPVARLFMQACEGLSAAHELGVVHRDIKPSNMFLHHFPTGELRLKICDFGIAKQLEGEEGTASITHTGGVIGSPQYMSPEQTKDAKTVDNKSDVWSLCISLYEALAGVTPWDGRSSVGELIVAICTESPTHLQDNAPWVEASLAEAVHGGLQQSAEQRHASMSVLHALLQPHAAEVVTSGNLLGVSSSLRTRQAARASRADTATLTKSEMVAKVRPTKRRSSTVTLGMVGALMAIVGIAIAWQYRAPEADNPVISADRPAIGGVKNAAPARHTVRVTIEPPTAEVEVDGEVKPLHDGALVLKGEAGDSYAVLARAHGNEERRTVVIRKNGTAQPQRIAVAAPADPPATPPATRSAPRTAPMALTAQPTEPSAPPRTQEKEKDSPKYDEEWRP